MSDTDLQEKPAEAPAKPNKTEMKKSARTVLNEIKAAEGETPLFITKIDTLGDKVRVTLDNTGEEPVVAKAKEALGEDVVLVLQPIVEGRRELAMLRAKKKAERDAQKPKTEGEGSARRSNFSGCTIHWNNSPLMIGENGEIVNPRREGTHGNVAMKKVMAFWAEHGKETPLPYEKYLELGGAAVHLNWDAEHGYVKILKADGTPAVEFVPLKGRKKKEETATDETKPATDEAGPEDETEDDLEDGEDEDEDEDGDEE